MDFWTYTCINCIRTLPYMQAPGTARYRRQGLTIVGVHTPEFAFERKAGNVSEAIEENGLRYPVAQDNDYGTWNAWGNQYWPAKYLIDAHGRVRYTHFGEGEYGETERGDPRAAGRGGDRRLGAPRTRTGRDGRRPDLATPETYLGFERAKGVPARRAASRDEPLPGRDELPPVHFAFGYLDVSARVGHGGGRRRAGRALDRAQGLPRAELARRAPARRRGAARRKAGQTAARPGADVTGGRATVAEERLYRLVSLPEAQDRKLTLRFPPGVSGYAFTFG